MIDSVTLHPHGNGSYFNKVKFLFPSSVGGIKNALYQGNEIPSHRYWKIVQNNSGKKTVIKYLSELVINLRGKC